MQVSSSTTNAEKKVLEQAAEALSEMSPYSVDEARNLLFAIASCRPASEIVDLLVCSHKDVKPNA